MKLKYKASEWKKVAPTKLDDDRLLQAYVISGLFSISNEITPDLAVRWKDNAGRCRREVLRRMK